MSDPWMKFYPNDWLGEPKLKLVSRAARSLWLDMLCLMHQAGTGRLEIKGRPMTQKELASILGDNPRTIKKLMAELHEAGVSIVVQGSFVASSRMIEDFKKAERDKSNGRKGGNPALKTREKDEKGVNPEVKAQKPEARSQKPDIGGGEGRAGAREPPVVVSMTERETVLEAMGADPVSGLVGASGKMIGRMADMQELRRWRDDLGLGLAEIIEVIHETMRQKRDGPPSTFTYFSQPMQRYAGAKNRPKLIPIEGGDHAQRDSRSGFPDRPQNRADPAIEQIARLAGIGETSGNGCG